MNFIVICLHGLDMRDFHSNMRNTPFLDKLRKESIFIPYGRAQAHHQGDSLNAEMTGKWTARFSNSQLTKDGFVNGNKFWLSKTTLEFLKEKGYNIITSFKPYEQDRIGTWAVETMKNAWLKEEPERLKQFSSPKEQSLDEWLTNIKKSKSKFYAHIFLRDTHRPWNNLERLGSLIPEEPPKNEWKGIFWARKAPLDKPNEFARLRRAGLESADKRVQKIFEETKHIKDTVYLVYSNHGAVFDHFRYIMPYKNFGNNIIVGTSHNAFPYEVLYANMQMWKIPDLKPNVLTGISRSIDIPPTILELADVKHDKMDGESMIPYFKKGSFPLRPRYAENLFGCCSLVRKDNFKFLSVNLPSRIPGEEGQKSVIAKYHTLAVFDLTADPWEYHNLIDSKKGQEVLKWAIEEHKRLKEQK